VVRGVAQGILGSTNYDETKLMLPATKLTHLAPSCGQRQYSNPVKIHCLVECLPTNCRIKTSKEIELLQQPLTNVLEMKNQLEFIDSCQTALSIPVDHNHRGS
jgi:hypothetical protein